MSLNLNVPKVQNQLTPRLAVVGVGGAGQSIISPGEQPLQCRLQRQIIEACRDRAVLGAVNDQFHPGLARYPLEQRDERLILHRDR